MKPRFQILGWIFLCTLATACASDPPEPEPTAPPAKRGMHAAETADQENLDDSLDPEAGKSMAKSAAIPAAPAEAAPTEEAEEPAPLHNPAAELPLFSAKPKTRYQVIQEGFDRANIMPTVNDFDPLDEPSPHLSCYSAKAGDPNTVSEMVIKQMMVQIPGTADYGPLFPGSLDHVETRLVIGKNNGWVNSQNLTNDMRQVFELAKAPGSLVIRINENKFGIYQDIGAPAEIWIRKDTRSHLFFKVYRLGADRVRAEVFIGYCFLRSALPNVR
jgi:hypothetical protein